MCYLTRNFHAGLNLDSLNFLLIRTKIKHVKDVLCGGSFKFMQLMQLRSRYHSVHNKVIVNYIHSATLNLCVKTSLVGCFRWKKAFDILPFIFSICGIGFSFVIPGKMTLANITYFGKLDDQTNLKV